MNPPRALVADVLPFSSVDGPGNRFVVFLQGCNFDCIACHNPWTIGVCTSCGDCVPACPSGALGFTPDGTVRWDPGACDGVERCIAVCPYDATPKARWATTASLTDELRGPAPFLSGVTVSGGEATEQAGFVEAWFRTLSLDPGLAHLSRFVDTNGSAPRAVWERLLPVMDGAMVDLKAFDEDVHRMLTGQPNAPVLDTIRFLAAHDRLHEVRLLVVPGVNDDRTMLARTAEWLSGVDPRLRVKVMGFRCHGVRPLARHLAEPTPEQLAEVEALLHRVGLAETVVV